MSQVVVRDRRVKRPGIRGGRFWIDRKGNVRYGPMPKGRRVALGQIAGQGAPGLPSAWATFKPPSLPSEHVLSQDKRTVHRLFRHILGDLAYYRAVRDRLLEEETGLFFRHRDQVAGIALKAKAMRAIADEIRKNPDAVDSLKAFFMDRFNNSSINQYAEITAKHLASSVPASDLSKLEARDWLDKTVSYLIHQWAVTSADHHPLSLIIQEQASELFGLAMPEFLKIQMATTAKIDSFFWSDARVDRARRAVRHFLLAQYKATQRALREIGVQHLYVLRGMRHVRQVLPDDQEVGQRTLELQPLSSFSLDSWTAMEFADGHLLLAARVPRRRVFSTFGLGFGCADEAEVVLLGGKLKAWVIEPKPGSFERAHELLRQLYQMAQSQRGIQKSHGAEPALSPDADPDNADWVKQTWDLPRDRSALRALLGNMSAARFRELPAYRLPIQRKRRLRRARRVVLVVRARNELVKGVPYIPRGVVVLEPPRLRDLARDVVHAVRRVLHPGIRGGKFWIDRHGNIRYGPPPKGRFAWHEIQAHHVRRELARYVMRFEPAMSITMDELRSLFGKSAVVTGRLKATESLFEKLQRVGAQKGRTLHDITDVAGVRAVFQNLSDLYAAIEKVRQHFGERIREEQNYLDQPKAGYRSYHLVIEAKGRPVEIQLRTRLQNAWADWAHDVAYAAKAAWVPKALQEYAAKLSEALWHRDQGHNVPLPECPPLVRLRRLCFKEAEVAA